MTECLFNTSVPVTVKSVGGSVPPLFAPLGASIPPPMAAPMPFYSTAAPVQFLDPATSERRLNSVVFEIYLIPMMANKKTLQLRVSDVHDPFFMWQLDLTEEEFFAVRRDQNLLVDFAHFPYKLIELLQRCLAAAAEQPPSLSAQLTTGQEEHGRPCAMLSFLETTSFRQVTQLALRLRAVGEESMKRHLSELLRQYRDQISSLQSQLTTMSSVPASATVHTPMSMPPSTTRATNGTGTTGAKMAANAQLSGMQSLMREKDDACAHLNQLYELTKEAKDKADQENGELRRETGMLMERFEESQHEVSKANDIIAKLQDEMRTLKAKLKSTVSIADDQTNAAEQLRAANKRLQTDYAELATQAHDAKVHAEALERDNKTLRGQIDQLERNIQQRDAIIAHHQRQTNVKDLDRAMRNLDSFGGGSEALGAPRDAGESRDNADFTFDSAPGDAGYVGSKIFTQSF